jgi:transcriptional regulator with XRE-family HTH domain
MAKTGDKVKYHLKQQGISIIDFAKKCNLPIDTIQNVIYNKSRRKEIIEKVASSLGVSVNYLLYEEDENISKDNYALKTRKFPSPVNHDTSHPFDSIRYSVAFNLIHELSQKYKIMLSKQQLDEYSYDLYLYCLQNGSDDNISRSFAEGMIYNGLKIGVLSNK